MKLKKSDYEPITTNPIACDCQSFNKQGCPNVCTMQVKGSKILKNQFQNLYPGNFICTQHYYELGDE